MRNYSNVFIGGSNNLRASSFKDQAASDMHAAQAMVLLKKQSSSNVTEYAPIVRALHTLDSDAEGKLKCKFDIAFLKILTWHLQRQECCAILIKS